MKKITATNPKTSIPETSQNKPPVIDKRTDKTVDSISVAVAFIVLGIFLSVSPTFFFDESITSIIRWVFVILGILGLGFSFGDKQTPIKGTSDMSLGILFLAGAVALSYAPIGLFAHLFALILALFGIFGTTRGVLFLIISSSREIAKQKKDHGKSKGALLIVEFLTKIIALIIVVIQLAELLL